MTETTHKPQALLLLGATGSGKTPLGDLLEQQGLAGRTCRHFDFGEQLRQAVAAERPPGDLTADEVEFLKGVLATGALLEDEHFHIAERILQSFIAARQMGADDLLILNGLPRHVGQAGDVDAIVDVRAVIRLSCTPDTIRRRIAVNAGGDRADRVDDDEAAVRRKLAVFDERTAPLAEHYRRRGAKIVTIDVTAEDAPEDICRNCRLQMSKKGP